MKKLMHGIYLLGCMSILVACQTTHIDPQKDAKRAKFHYQIGLDSLQRGQLPKAFDELMQANEISPKQTNILEALAYAWRLQGNMKQAESFYKQSIAIKPTPSAYTNYGSLLVALKRYHEAEKMLNKALEDPRYRKQYVALLLLGDVALAQNELEKSIQYYRKAAMISPNQQALAQLKEAHAYMQSGRLNYAQALYETMLRTDPTQRAVLESLLVLLAQRADIQTARKHLAHYIEKVKDPLQRAWANDELIQLNRASSVNKRN